MYFTENHIQIGSVVPEKESVDFINPGAILVLKWGLSGRVQLPLT